MLTDIGIDSPGGVPDFYMLFASSSAVACRVTASRGVTAKVGDPCRLQSDVADCRSIGIIEG